MTVTRISEDTFGDLLRSFRQTAFRLESRDAYAMDFEHGEFARFLAGSPRPPSEIGWWKDWLDQIAGLASAGKHVSRVRVLAEPPSDYQRWMLWAAPWYAQAGEDIRYMTHREACDLGLPDADWWLLDDEQAVILGFGDSDRLEALTLVTDPELIARYINWRDLAVRYATTAEHVAAA
jgi:uncharacterized protein DUF6879